MPKAYYRQCNTDQKLTLSENELASGKHRTATGDSKAGWTDSLTLL